MKILPYIIGIILLANVLACQRETTYPLAMQQAESLMNTRPDSALHLLQGMADSISTFPEEAQMYYHLLTIQAKDKQYITHTSDSLINRIVSFYEEYNDNDRLMMAYFYQGSTYRDMNDAPQALKAFHQAIDAGKETENLTLLGQTYGQMGTLFSYQKLYDEALEAKQNAFHLYSVQKDSARIPYLMRDIARIYRAKNNPDSALYYYNKAYQLASGMKVQRQKYNIMSEWGCMYYNIGKKDTAQIMLENVIAYNPNASNALLFLGIIYRERNQTDSAFNFFQRSLKSKDMNHRRTAYFHLSQLAKLNGKTQDVFSYQTMYKKLQDSIDIITQTEEMEKYHLLYQFQRSEKENDALKLEKEQKTSQIYGLVIIIIFALSASVIVFIYYSKEKETTRLQQKRIQKLKEEINSQQENQKKVGLKKTIQLDILKRPHTEQVKISPYTEIEWGKLQNVIEQNFPNFTKSLYLLHPDITLQELRVCLLLKAGTRVKDIAQLMNLNSTAVTHLRSRLYTKITNLRGNGKDLDKIIADL